MPKVEQRKRKASMRHNPLHQQILASEGPYQSNRVISRQKRKLVNPAEHAKTLENCSNLEGEEEMMIPSKLGKRLLQIVEEQQGSEEELFDCEKNDESGGEQADEDGFVVVDSEDDEDNEFYTERSSQEASRTACLADIVVQQLKSELDPQLKQENETALSPKVVEVYTAMVPFLSRYRSGKIPKAFKIIPRLHAWEEILLLTSPTSWSKQATRAATKIFCSNLRETMAQRFLCTVLLPAVRDDIAENKKLNYHLYMALKHSLFKPGAFFKGIYLPLALKGCTIREAVIVASVVSKVSIPLLHGAAALFRLATVPPEHWVPSVSHMMNVLIDKKYSLPVEAIDECVKHFCGFADNSVKVTLAWHKCLLSLAQRYKAHFTDSDRARLRKIVKINFHDKVGPEIHRELAAQLPALHLEQQQCALLSC